MASLDDRIDELFAGPLAGFTAARNALARTLTGADAARVKALTKPTVVAWAINQMYWHARDTFDRVIDTGARLRKAQIAALEGKSVDLRAATSAHRQAIAAAVTDAERLAAAAGSHPSPDALTRTLETLSLSPKPPAPFGRLTTELQPAGFEALAGVSPAASRRAPAESRTTKAVELRTGKARQPHETRAQSSARQREAEAAKRLEAEARERAAEQRKREADIRKAEAALARAHAAERMAHDAWLRAQKEVDDARQRLTEAKSR